MKNLLILTTFISLTSPALCQTQQSTKYRELEAIEVPATPAPAPQLAAEAIPGTFHVNASFDTDEYAADFESMKYFASFVTRGAYMAVSLPFLDRLGLFEVCDSFFYENPLNVVPVAYAASFAVDPIVNYVFGD